MNTIQQLKAYIHTIFKVHAGELKRSAGPAAFFSWAQIYCEKPGLAGYYLMLKSYIQNFLNIEA
jgi:hypothetical protein